jgi:hypothetical protein
MTDKLLIDIIDNINIKTNFDKNTNIYTVNIYILEKYYNNKPISNKILKLVKTIIYKEKGDKTITITEHGY